MDKKHFFDSLCIKGKYKQVQKYLTEIQNSNQDVWNSAQEVILEIINSNKCPLLGKLSALKFLKQAALTGNLQFFQQLDQKILKHIITISQYKKQSKEDTRGQTYFIQKQKRVDSAQTKTLGSSYLIYILEMIKTFADWMPDDQDNQNYWKQIYKSQLKKGVTFPKTQNYFKKEEKNKFIKNVNAFYKNQQQNQKNEQKKGPNESQYKKKQEKKEQKKEVKEVQQVKQAPQSKLNNKEENFKQMYLQMKKKFQDKQTQQQKALDKLKQEKEKVNKLQNQLKKKENEKENFENNVKQEKIKDLQKIIKQKNDTINYLRSKEQVNIKSNPQVNDQLLSQNIVKIKELQKIIDEKNYSILYLQSRLQGKQPNNFDKEKQQKLQKNLYKLRDELSTKQFKIKQLENQLKQRKISQNEIQLKEQNRLKQRKIIQLENQLRSLKQQPTEFKNTVQYQNQKFQIINQQPKTRRAIKRTQNFKNLKSLSPHAFTGNNFHQNFYDSNDHKLSSIVRRNQRSYQPNRSNQKIIDFNESLFKPVNLSMIRYRKACLEKKCEFFQNNKIRLSFQGQNLNYQQFRCVFKVKNMGESQIYIKFICPENDKYLIKVNNADNYQTRLRALQKFEKTLFLKLLKPSLKVPIIILYINNEKKYIPLPITILRFCQFEQMKYKGQFGSNQNSIYLKTNNFVFEPEIFHNLNSFKNYFITNKIDIIMQNIIEFKVKFIFINEKFNLRIERKEKTIDIQIGCKRQSQHIARIIIQILQFLLKKYQ